MSILSRFVKKSPAPEPYDPALYRPVLRASVCTGEKTAGFLETGTGKFREVMLIRNEADLKKFREQYGIEGEIRTVY